jgi:hypothetical protein
LLQEVFSQLSLYYSHVGTHIPATDIAPSSSTEKSPPGALPAYYVCYPCKEPFSSLPRFKQHYYGQHTNPVKCQLCDKVQATTSITSIEVYVAYKMSPKY